MATMEANRKLFSEVRMNGVDLRVHNGSKRKPGDYCSLCGFKLTNSAKAKNVDHGFPLDKRVCIDCAYKIAKRKIDVEIADRLIWENRFKRG